VCEVLGNSQEGVEMFKIGERSFGFGVIIALVVLIVSIVVLCTGWSKEWAAIGALALAYLVG